MDERKFNRRRALIAASVLAAAAVAVFWLDASEQLDTAALTSLVGFKPAPKKNSPSTTKPICSQVIVPAGDCIPQHLANLPPDPGPEGMKTLEGIDSDKDGVRDDVQRYIAETWPQSERARRALTNIAKSIQAEVVMGDSVSKEEARAFAQKVGAKNSGCFTKSVEPAIRFARAVDSVGIKVMNTPERYNQVDKFSRLLHGSMFELDTSPLIEQCGYDPSTLPD